MSPGRIHGRGGGGGVSPKGEIEPFMGSEIPQTGCFPAVGIAYRLVVDLLKETS
jgi:hypothetical protein